MLRVKMPFFLWQSIRPSFCTLDPPYIIDTKKHKGRYYPTPPFDHEGLAERLRERTGWVMSYNDSYAVRKLYRGYKIIPVEWQYNRPGAKCSSEILIVS